MRMTTKGLGLQSRKRLEKRFIGKIDNLMWCCLFQNVADIKKLKQAGICTIKVRPGKEAKSSAWPGIMKLSASELSGISFDSIDCFIHRVYR